MLTIMKEAHNGTSVDVNISTCEIVSYCRAGTLTSKRIAVTTMHQDYQSGNHSIGECVDQDNDCQTLGIHRDHAFIRHGFKQSILDESI
jgi:hypothetical protein